MPYEGYECLEVAVDAGVATVTFDNPPINLLDLPLLGEIDRLGRELAGDPALRVAVFQSADPEFFIAHADVSLIQRLPRDPGPRPSELGFFHAAMERFRTAMDVFLLGKLDEDAPMSVSTELGERYLGIEVDFLIEWQLWNDLSFDLRYGIFIPGEAYFTSDERHFGYAAFSYAF